LQMSEVAQSQHSEDAAITSGKPRSEKEVILYRPKSLKPRLLQKHGRRQSSMR